MSCGFRKLDLRLPDAALSAMKNVDLCIALAARSAGVGFFNDHPAEMLDDNIRMLSATFRAATTYKIQKILYVSSSCVFDNSRAHPIVETSLRRAPSPSAGYPFSKFVGEFYCHAFQRQHGLAYTIIRPFNVYGPGELPGRSPGDSHVIPDLTKKILSGQTPLEIFGSGRQKRSFTYVDDIAEGIVLALENRNAENQDFNLGHGPEISIRRLAKELWKLCGRTDGFAIESTKAYDVDAKRRSVNTRKAGTVLGWKPKIRLSEGLDRYVEWYRGIALKEVK